MSDTQNALASELRKGIRPKKVSFPLLAVLAVIAWPLCGFASAFISMFISATIALVVIGFALGAAGYLLGTGGFKKINAYRKNTVAVDDFDDRLVNAWFEKDPPKLSEANISWVEHGDWPDEVGDVMIDWARGRVEADEMEFAIERAMMGLPLEFTSKEKQEAWKKAGEPLAHLTRIEQMAAYDYFNAIIRGIIDGRHGERDCSVNRKVAKENWQRAIALLEIYGFDCSFDMHRLQKSCRHRDQGPNTKGDLVCFNCNAILKLNVDSDKEVVIRSMTDPEIEARLLEKVAEADYELFNVDQTHGGIAKVYISSDPIQPKSPGVKRSLPDNLPLRQEPYYPSWIDTLYTCIKCNEGRSLAEHGMKDLQCPWCNPGAFKAAGELYVSDDGRTWKNGKPIAGQGRSINPLTGKLMKAGASIVLPSTSDHGFRDRWSAEYLKQLKKNAKRK